jgi:integrative and conjugative element protein (TIGR02256 family)
MQRAAPVVWMSHRALSVCIHEATRHFPHETGGTFMGYWTSAHEVVITHLVEAGPSARRERAAFEPDQQWQLGEIARHYSASGRRESYLGDWHSHPGAANGELSRTDRAVLSRIVRSPRARAPRPISMVLFGDAAQWHPCAWVATMHPRALMRSRLICERATLHLYG